MRKEHDLARSAFFTAIGNNTISLLAGMLVFGTVFAVLWQEMGMNRPRGARDRARQRTGVDGPDLDLDAAIVRPHGVSASCWRACSFSA